MNQLRIGSGLMALGAPIWVVGAIAPWSSIRDQNYSGATGEELAWITGVLAVVIVASSGLAGRQVAAMTRWVLLPIGAIGLLLTVAITIDIATFTSADVARTIDDPDATRELAWGIWVSLAGAVIATIAGIVAVLAPSPRRDTAATPS